MKNKKAGQIENKARHKQNLKAAKARRRGGEPMLERPEPTRVEKPVLLIVCEGENTEPSYFRRFRLTSATIKTVGEGYNTVSLVNRTAQLAEEGRYDQVWCVFDKDDFADHAFNDAIRMAESKEFRVAYSNQAFEYWLILHFEDHQGGSMSRADYPNKLNSYLQPYGEQFNEDSKVITEGIFSVLEQVDQKTQIPRPRLAIQRARQIFNRLEHHSPATEESSTAVFLLVEEILKYV